MSEFGGFTIVSSEENNGDGVGLKPVVIPELNGGCRSSDGSCSSCGGDANK